jgi:hypothetical protein
LAKTSSAGASALVLPVAALYLFRFSETPSYLEIGAGVSSAILSVRSSTVEPSSATVYAPHLTFALIYRYMPDDSGLSVRVGVTPLLLPNLFLPWLGVSLGWTFGD